MVPPPNFCLRPSSDLQEIIDGLLEKDSALAELDDQIADSLDGEEFNEEIAGALDYHEKIGNAVSRLRSALNARASTDAAVMNGYPQRPAVITDVSGNANGAPRAPSVRVALPKLQIPVLYGESR